MDKLILWCGILIILFSLVACGESLESSSRANQQAMPKQAIVGTWVGVASSSDPIALTVTFMADGTYQTTHQRGNEQESVQGTYTLLERNRIQMEFGDAEHKRTEILEYTATADTLVIQDQEKEVMKLTKSP